MLRRIASLSVVLFALIQLSQAQNETYNQGEISGNNTAACSAPGYGLQISPSNAPPYCENVFPWSQAGNEAWYYPGGWADDSTSAIVTFYHDPTPAGNSAINGSSNWSIAKGRPPVPNKPAPPFYGDMHTLMYGGNYTTVPKTNIVVELQSWFCDPNESPANTCVFSETQSRDNNEQITSYYDSHADVEYTTWDESSGLDSPTMDARTVDIWDRGGDTVAMDWYGGPNDCPPTNQNYLLTNYSGDCTQSPFNKLTFKWSDVSYQYMANQSIPSTLTSVRPGADMSFFLIMDHGAWKEPCEIVNAGQLTPWCGANKMVADLAYAFTGKNEGGTGSSGLQPNAQPYFNLANYATFNGFPIIAFFQNEQCTQSSGCTGDLVPPNCQQNGTYPCCLDSSPCQYDQNSTDLCSESNSGKYPDCYMEMYKTVHTYLAGSKFGPTGFYMIFVYNSGCPNQVNSWENHPYSDGCYAWVSAYPAVTPGNISYQSQQYNETIGNGAQQALKNFYYNALNTICPNGLSGCKGYNNNPILFMGGAFKGFDDYMTTGEYQARVLTQGCGTTWLSTWNEMTDNNWFTPQNPLPYMMVETWDDYEEGTEIETGIDNCLLTSNFQSSINTQSTQLTWSYDFNNPNPGTMSDLATTATIDHYDLYSATNCQSDCSNYALLAWNITPSEANCSSANYPLISCQANVYLNTYNLPPLGQNQYYGIFVEAVGKPGITNWVTPTGQKYAPQ